MNDRLNKMIEQFIKGDYDADEFCYDFNDEWIELQDDIVGEAQYIYDEINYCCGMYDDTHSYDDRLLSLEEFKSEVEKEYKKLLFK